MAKHKNGWQTSKIERLSYYLFFAGQLIFKKMLPMRKKEFERNNRITVGHVQKVEYITSITI